MLTDEKKQKLIHVAIDASKKAYVPYSRYRVGAALLTNSGMIFRGANVENAVYPLTICAERTAVVKAVSEGERSFEAIAVVTKNGGTPCGACRQVLAEFGLNTTVLIANFAGELLLEITVGELLPHSFGDNDLKIGREN